MKLNYRYLTLFALLALMTGIVTSCKHEPLLPKGVDDGGGDDGGGGSGGGGGGGGGTGTPCDPNIVYFEQQILPILVSSCAKSGCHDAATGQDGVILNNYQNVMVTGEVTPFNLGDSEIWEVITETDPDDVMPPPGENPLTQAQINLIALWINQGAQNLYCDNNINCDSTNVSYLQAVRPILNDKCVGCHTSATASNGNVNLSTYTGVATVAANGRLVGAIKHSAGYAAMPQGGPSLSICEIAKISNWVSEGYSNN